MKTLMQKILAICFIIVLLSHPLTARAETTLTTSDTSVAIFDTYFNWGNFYEPDDTLFSAVEISGQLRSAGLMNVTTTTTIHHPTPYTNTWNPSVGITYNKLLPTVASLPIGGLVFEFEVEATVAPGIHQVLNLQGASGLYPGALAQPGDVVVARVRAYSVHNRQYRLRFEMELQINGVVVAEVLDDNRTSDTTLSIRGRSYNITYTNPVVKTNPDVTKYIASYVDWTEHLTAAWGRTATNTIPDMGLITDTSLTTDLGDGLKTDTRLSADGVVYNRIGVVTHHYLIQDDHALNTTDPQYAGDNTSATTSRTITVKTPLAPNLIVRYGDGMTAPNGDSIAGNIYDATALLNDCGGEAGWTNKKLDIEVNPAIAPNPILGTFDSVLKIPNPSETITQSSSSAGGVAKKKNYHTQTAASGVIPTGVLTQQGVATNALSAQVSGKLLVDLTNPVPKAINNGDGTFDDDSSDALSGLSSVHESLIAFVPTGGLAPGGEAYTKFDELPTLVTGQYDVWVWAFDKAGNSHKALALSNQTINGISIGFTKDANKEAIVHINGCPNKDEMTVKSGCHGDCREGTHKELLSEEELTYELKVQNGDTSNTLTGIFTDYLPQGMIPTSTPTTSPDGKATSIAYVEEGGRWKITGNVSVEANGTALIPIACKAPADTDASLGADKVISNQATFTWTLGSGAGATTGSSTSNHANHRINTAPSITKEANLGAAIHESDCPNSTSLEKIAGCKPECEAGNTGLVGAGDIITYKMTFANPSDAIYYFATDASSFYDQMPVGVTLSEQEWSVSLSEPQGTFSDGGTLPDTGTSSVTGTWPHGGGNSLEGLTFDVDSNGITQEGNNSLSLAPGATLEITVKAKVTDAGSDNLVNQVKSGYKLYGDHNTSLTTADTGVISLNSNYTTHERTIRGVATKFTKVGADDLDTPLAGARFALYKWTDTIAAYSGHEEDILDVTKLNGVDDGDATIKWLRATTDGADGTTSDVFTTLADGKVDLGMLPDGIYTLIETKAPDGYELPVGQWVLTINNSKGNTGDGDYKIEYTAKGEMLPPAVRIDTDAETGDLTYQVVNVRPFSIGMSGMNGTKGITIIGLAIMLIAGVSYSIYNLKKSRKSRKKR